MRQKHCIICDDGGQLILCSSCDAVCCYNEADDESLSDDLKEELANGACITLPKGYAEDRHRVFRCPRCLSEHPERSIDVSVRHYQDSHAERLVFSPSSTP